jgi:4-hydroxy-3-methylbut-2-enyl diphosphate reductase
MKVIRAGTLGFCMGVRRAVEMASAAAREAADRRVYTLGPLIHNPQVLEDLRRRGVEILEGVPPEPERAVLIIRAHGVPPQIEKKFKCLGALVVDATCPTVKASQLKAMALAKQGFCIFLAGEERHGELVGIKGYAESGPPLPEASLWLVGNPAEAEAAARELAGRDRRAKTVLLGQTTISPAEYEAIGEGIKKYFPGLTIVDTICGATRERQDSLRELCAGVGGVIVAGGRGSANTRRLLDIALGLGKPARLIEGAGEISPEARSDISSWGIAGLSAGASTPDRVVDEIEAALERL